MKEELTKERILTLLRSEMPALRQEYGVEQLALYGSFAKGQHKKKSDIDILVQLMKPLGLKFIDLAYHLENLLGKKVDLTTFDVVRRNRSNPRYQQIANDIERTLIHV